MSFQILEPTNIYALKNKSFKVLTDAEETDG